MRGPITFPAFVAGMAFVLCGALSTETCRAQSSYVITLDTGTRFSASVAEQTIKWTNVASDGRTSNRSVSLANVRLMELTSQPASEQVEHVRQLIVALGSEKYVEREAAELELSREDVGGAYRSLIELNRESEIFEVRYRIGRILETLKDSTPQIIPGFDRLVLKDGTELEGDAGAFEISCQFGNRNVSLNRERIVRIAQPDKVAANAAPAAIEPNVSVRVFQEFEGEFFLPHQTQIDFETDPSTGETLTRTNNLSDVYLDLGLKPGCKQPGFIGISGYGFKFDERPTGGNSACVFSTDGSYAKRFRGIAEFTFCQPGNPEQIAGVNEFGVFIARCNHYRDFILEAFNADGSLLATVEASDHPCPFLGFKVSEPATRVRILSNPYLFRISRNIDEDYAFDNLCFSTPVAVDSAGTGIASLRLKNGNSFAIDRIEIEADRVEATVTAFDDPFVFRFEDIKSISFENPGTPDDRESWIAMLPDRSLVKFAPGASPRWVDWSDLEFDLDSLIALGSARNPMRFPYETDFDHGKYLLTFPSCRLAAQSLNLNETGFAWDEDAKKLTQNLILLADTVPDPAAEDPTPDFSSVAYDEDVASEIPTIWIAPPPAPEPGCGLLKLRDGQQFVINGSSGFTIANLDKQQVVIAQQEQTLAIPWERIRSINFPE